MPVEMEIFSWYLVFFPSFCFNVGCGCSLEPPRRSGSNEYPQPMFFSKNKTNNVYHGKTHFSLFKWVFYGVRYMDLTIPICRELYRAWPFVEIGCGNRSSCVIRPSWVLHIGYIWTFCSAEDAGLPAQPQSGIAGLQSEPWTIVSQIHE